jgi:hypothetical protein
MGYPPSSPVSHMTEANTVEGRTVTFLMSNGGAVKRI